MHYIKLTDMVTGRGHLDINRISGYLPGKIVGLLLQVESVKHFFYVSHACDKGVAICQSDVACVRPLLEAAMHDGQQLVRWVPPSRRAPCHHYRYTPSGLHVLVLFLEVSPDCMQALLSISVAHRCVC